MHVLACFTNFGPYHLARLRALGEALEEANGRLTAVEVASAEGKYPWSRRRGEEPFRWLTLFEGVELESLAPARCAGAMREVLEWEDPDAVAACGYARAESMAMAEWARRRGKRAVLMSESQYLDHPRVWWKEAIKRRRVARFGAGLVGGARHRAYLEQLGMPGERIALGYNAVDHAWYERQAEQALARGKTVEMPARPYFLAVNRFVPEKQLVELVGAYAAYRDQVGPVWAWDLVLAGDGPERDRLHAAVQRGGLEGVVHFPGFLQAERLAGWYAHAGAFVHPSRLEPWGLVVNEAAACGLPLLVSERAGCVETLVPEPAGTTGYRLASGDCADWTRGMIALTGLDECERRAMGARARDVGRVWGPARFASGMMEALARAGRGHRSRGMQEVGS